MLAGRGTQGERSPLHLGSEIRMPVKVRTVGSDLFGDITNPMPFFLMTWKLHGSFIKNFSVQFSKFYNYLSDCT